MRPLGVRRSPHDALSCSCAPSMAEPPAAAVAAAGAAAAGDPSRLWTPLLIQRLASFMSPNEVAGTLRLVDKTAAAALPAPEYAAITLSRPVPTPTFVRRWGDPRTLAALSWDRRRQLLRLTAASGCLANLEFLLAMEDYFPMQPDIMEAAAGVGQLVVCQALRQRGCSWDFMVFIAAARGGHSAVCEWLLAGGCPWTHASNMARDGDAPSSAIRGGHLALADQLLAAAEPNEQGRRVSDTTCLKPPPRAATCQRSRGFMTPWDETSAGTSKSTGTSIPLPCAVASSTPDWRAKARWLLACGLETEDFPMMCAATYQELYQQGDWRERLEWLRRRRRWWWRSMIDEFPRAAIMAGNADAVRWLLPQVFGLNQQLDTRGSLLCRYCYLAVKEGHFDILQLLLTEPSNLPGSGPGEVQQGVRAALRAALQDGDLQLASWLEERLGLPISELTNAAALMAVGAASGSVEVMEWLRVRGCPCDARTFCAAADAGSEEALDWLAERGCPMGEHGEPYETPAGRGDLVTLRCLRRLGCAWDADGATIAGAVWVRAWYATYDGRYAHLYAHRPTGLAWLLEQGCPVREDWDMDELTVWAVGVENLPWLRGIIARRTHQEDLLLQESAGG